MREESASRDAKLARIASRQHGIVTHTQLIDAGIARSAITRRIAAGRLHRLHRGVYAVGHRPPSYEAGWIAAVLAGGPGAVLSHRSAAELWQLLKPANGPIHITLPTAAGRRQRPGLRIHRSAHLPNTATTRRNGIAVTAPARTLCDLRRTAEPAIYRRALRQAEFLGLPLNGIETDGTRSELETAFLALCRRHRIAPPEVNVGVGVFTVDFLWREPRLIVEVDGYAAHRGRQAFDDDRARDADLARSGYRVIRFSQRQIDRDSDRVAELLCALLAVPIG